MAERKYVFKFPQRLVEKPLASSLVSDYGLVVNRRERCTDCSACCNVCPSGALSVQRPGMSVQFDGEKCIACGLCIPACPYSAVEVAL
jgi:NAD-dependent dihydropyrimidine dehydrogenase PreA subunit